MISRPDVVLVLWQLISVTVYIENFLTLLVYYSVIWMDGTVIEQLFNVLDGCVFIAICLVISNGAQGYQHSGFN